MHEYAVTKNLIDIAVQEASKAGASRITEIRLVVGDLSSYVDESVQMYFDIISKGTPAEGARLSFTRIPAEFVCAECGLRFERKGRSFDCPDCGGPGSLDEEKGREFYVESIEVE